MLAGRARPLVAAPAGRPKWRGWVLLLRPPKHTLPASLPDLSAYPSNVTVSMTVGRVSVA